MPLSTFEKLLPWSGAVAGLAFVGRDLLARFTTSDVPGGASVEVVTEHAVLNGASMACTVLMGVALIFFATAVRTLLRSGEAGEATYSAVAYGGWITVSAALGQMALWERVLVSAAADRNAAAVEILGYAHYFGWLAMGIGVSTAFVAAGLGGVRNALLPRWFAVTTLVLGVLGMLGAAGIPPGGLVTYLLLPFWLVAASVVVSRRQGFAARTGRDVPVVA